MKEGLPFADGTFDAVYHAHILEHLAIEEAPRFMQECVRVTKAGGIVRVVVPDLEAICRLYVEKLEGQYDESLAAAEIPDPSDMVRDLEQFLRSEQRQRRRLGSNDGD